MPRYPIWHERFNNNILCNLWRISNDFTVCRLQRDLERLSLETKTKNLDRDHRYDWLDPEVVPNSISVWLQLWWCTIFDILCSYSTNYLKFILSYYFIVHINTFTKILYIIYQYSKDFSRKYFDKKFYRNFPKKPKMGIIFNSNCHMSAVTIYFQKSWFTY